MPAPAPAPCPWRLDRQAFRPAPYRAHWLILAASSAVLLAAACSFPRPPDVPGDGHEPGPTILVSPTGDDANDGLTQPVKTLRRAIMLAGASQDPTTIQLAEGRYESRSGETFPYTISDKITLTGPEAGGAIVIGEDTSPGLILAGGRLRHLEFEHFSTALIGAGMAEITNVHVRSSALALRADAASKLVITGFDISGVPGSCSVGAELNADASVTVTDSTFTGLVISFNVKEQSVFEISSSTITGDTICNQPNAGVMVTTSKSATFRDVEILGGNNGVVVNGKGIISTQVLIERSTLRNLARTAVATGQCTMKITDTEIADSSMGMGSAGSEIELTRVLLRQNASTLEIGVGGSLSMRNSAIVEMAPQYTFMAHRPSILAQLIDREATYFRL